MDRNRLWLIGGALVLGVVVITGWFLGIAPQLKLAHDTRIERITVEEQNVGFEVRLASLEEQFNGIGELEEELSELREAIPGAAELPDFVRQVAGTAAEHQVSVTSITMSDPQPFVSPEASASTDVATEPASAAVPATTETDTPAATSSLSPEEFLAVPVTVIVEGGNENALAFVQGLQFGDRVITVTNLSMQQLDVEDTADAVTTTITGLIYVLLDASAE